MKKTICLFAAVCLIISLLAGCSFGQQNIELNNKELTMVVGDSKVLSVIPESANKKLTWSTSDSSVATVENGTVKAKAVGSSVVTAVTESGASASCNITVTGKEISAITLSNQTATLDAGKSIQLKATITPADATDTNLTWSSSDSSIALVNSEGYVTAVSEGVANIICKANNGIEASCTVTIKGSTKKQDEQSSEQSSEQQSSEQPANRDNGGYYGHFNPAYTYRASDFVFPDSSTRQLTSGEISSVLSSMTGKPVSKSFAQDAINEIYARNGYVFKTDSIRKYYESKPWYYADPTFTINDFNSYETYNIKLLDSFS